MNQIIYILKKHLFKQMMETVISSPILPFQVFPEGLLSDMVGDKVYPKTKQNRGK